jgi:hypothetical protein
MNATSDLDEMLRTMRPVLREGEYVYAVIDGPVPDDLQIEALVREPEGTTVVVRREIADAAGLSYDFVARWIMLTLVSSLSAVGLTAAFSTALGDAAISCNVLAGHHHDHILVPAADADSALGVLHALAERSRR